MYQETVARYADLAKAAGDLKRAVSMIESWTAKAEDARKRLVALGGVETVNDTQADVTYVYTNEVPVTEEPVTQPQ